MLGRVEDRDCRQERDRFFFRPMMFNKYGHSRIGRQGGELAQARGFIVAALVDREVGPCCRVLSLEVRPCELIDRWEPERGLRAKYASVCFVMFGVGGIAHLGLS